MTPYLQDADVTVYQGDCLDVLRTLPEESVHMCVTSPPFFGLRDYGVDGQIGLEATPDEWCARLVGVFREVRRVLRQDGTLWCEVGDSFAQYDGQGNKDDPREPGLHGTFRVSPRLSEAAEHRGDRHSLPPGLKRKDLIGAPWMLAFALRADGWYLRQEIIWSKPNAMPESARDRCTTAHSRVFLLAKSGAPTYWVHRDHAGTRSKPRPDYRWVDDDPESATYGQENTTPVEGWKRINLWSGRDYFYDADAIREPYNYDGRKVTMVQQGDGSIQHRNGERWPGLGRATHGARAETTAHGHDESEPMDISHAGRNKRSVWTIPTQPLSEPHYAAFPEALVEPCILAGSSERGCCPECGAPWIRVVERGELTASEEARIQEWDRGKLDAASDVLGGGKAAGLREAGFVPNHYRPSVTTGWEPSCECGHEDTVPATVLDCFLGSGTTALVARRLGRRTIGIELSNEYCEISARRLRDPAALNRAALTSDVDAQLAIEEAS